MCYKRERERVELWATSYYILYAESRQLLHDHNIMETRIMQQAYLNIWWIWALTLPKTTIHEISCYDFCIPWNQSASCYRHLSWAELVAEKPKFLCLLSIRTNPFQSFPLYWSGWQDLGKSYLDGGLLSTEMVPCSRRRVIWIVWARTSADTVSGVKLVYFYKRKRKLLITGLLHWKKNLRSFQSGY